MRDALPRAILFRPERRSYVRGTRKKKSNKCVFCEAARKPVGFESLKIWQSEDLMVVLNKFPYNTGHLLALPKRHVANVEDLSDRELVQWAQALRGCVAMLKKAYKCPGLNVGFNLGSAAGAGIPDHLHLHIVPRWKGDTNFFPLLGGTKVVVETLEQTFERLLPLTKKYLDFVHGNPPPQIRRRKKR